MKYIVNCILALCLYGTAHAHNYNEISYHIEQNQQDWQLTVHFTPQTVLKLIDHLHPGMQNQAVVRVPDFQEDLIVYLQETVSVKLDGQTVSLDFQEADLVKHDATLVFRLTDAPVHFNDYTIAIESFVDVFHHTRNLVFLVKDGHVFSCTLDAGKRVCTTRNSSGVPKRSFASFQLIGLCVLFGMGWGVFRIKRTLSKSFNQI